MSYFYGTGGTILLDYYAFSILIVSSKEAIKILLKYMKPVDLRTAWVALPNQAEIITLNQANKEYRFIQSLGEKINHSQIQNRSVNEVKSSIPISFVMMDGNKTMKNEIKNEPLTLYFRDGKNKKLNENNKLKGQIFDFIV